MAVAAGEVVVECAADRRHLAVGSAITAVAGRGQRMIGGRGSGATASTRTTAAATVLCTGIHAGRYVLAIEARGIIAGMKVCPAGATVSTIRTVIGPTLSTLGKCPGEAGHAENGASQQKGGKSPELA
ncbi:hypothetical protein Brsp05_04704 [Brucella sp. NBRC 12953]